ncbi:MAG: VTT domain-containing protein, partial [Pseudomonadota bacterium]
GFSENALSYLLFLRLVPAFPFWLVNIAPGLLGVRLPTYVAGTFFGIIPGTMAFSFLGSGLDTTLSQANAEHKACVATNGADACTFALGVGDIVNANLLIAFALLGVVALIPIALKRFRKSSDDAPAAS